MEVSIKSLKFNLHTNIGELNEKRMKVLRNIIQTNDFNSEQPGPSNIILFTNSESKQALLITDSQIHFAFDECEITSIENYVKIVENYSKEIFDALLLDDKFNFNLEIIGEVPNSVGGKKAALEKSLEKFTSASRKTLKENLKEIEMVGLRFVNKIDNKSYDSKIEPLVRDNNYFYIYQVITYLYSQNIDTIRNNVNEDLNYFKGDFFAFLKNNFLI